MDYAQTICTTSDHDLNTCKVSKQSELSCRRSSIHSIPTACVCGGGGGRKERRTEGLNVEYYVPSLFFENAGDNKIDI